MAIRSALIFGIATLVLSGCLQPSQTADAIARPVAKSYVNSIVAKNFPGANVTAITDCIIDNASTAEAITIARSAALGGTQDAAQNIISIATRPETAICIASSELAFL